MDVWARACGGYALLPLADAPANAPGTAEAGGGAAAAGVSPWDFVLPLHTASAWGGTDGHGGGHGGGGGVGARPVLGRIGDPASAMDVDRCASQPASAADFATAARGMVSR